MIPQIQYTLTDDEVRIAYYRMGEGIPFLVASEIQWSHLSSTHGMREYYRSKSGLGVGRGMEVVRYDPRGIGLSERIPFDISRELILMDMEAVRRAVGFDRFVLFGHLNGCISAIEYAAAFPERVSHLVLASPYIRGWQHKALSEHFGALPADPMSESQWTGFTEAVSAYALGAQSETSERLARVYRNSMTPETYVRFIEWRKTVDLSDAIGRIRTPTLVIHRDARRSHALDLEVAQAIPGARLLRVEANEPAFQQWREAETDAIDHFVGVPVATPAPVGDPTPIRPGVTTTTAATARLTPREVQILRLLASGSTTQELAAALALSERTVSRHIANIYAKIDAHTRGAAIAYALRHGIA